MARRTKAPAARAGVALLVAALVGGAACTDDVDSPSGGGGGGDAAGGPGDVAEHCPGPDGEALAAWGAAGFSGTVTIMEDGEVTCELATGLADPATGQRTTVDTAFPIGSVTKAFTAATVARLAADGTVDLDEPVARWFPDLPAELGVATPRQLLVHTGGLAAAHGDDREPMTRDEALAAIAATPPAFAPGEGRSYSNSGYTLLAALVEEATGSSYRDEVASLLAPADVEAGWWEGDPTVAEPWAHGLLAGGEEGAPPAPGGEYWAIEGNGGLALTTGDLARWVAALDAGDVLEPAAREVLTTPLVDVEPGGPGDADDPLFAGAREAPGWGVLSADAAGETVLVSSGGGGDTGHEVVVSWLPESHRVVAVASNTPDVSAATLSRSVVPAMAAGEPLPVPDVAADVDLSAFVGRWELATGGALEVEADGDLLDVAAEGAEALAVLFPPPPGDAADAFAEHAAAVEAALAGETDAGREELDTLEEDLGTVTGVTVDGTIVAEGEVRTYVTLQLADGGTTTAWYALDGSSGQIAGVELEPAPPSLRMGALGPDTVGPLGLADTDPEVAIRLVDGGDAVEVVGPTGPTRGERA
jgi:CubicO group peptidase (beta-lactamase class C family)